MKKMQHSEISLVVFIFSTLMIISQAGPILNNLPITFQMTGATTFNPDSGGATLNGYQLKIGFSGYSWIAVQFVGSLKSDVLVVTQNDFYTGNVNPLLSGHQVLVKDYFMNQTGLHQDQITINDISSFSYAQTKQYSVEMIRYLGSNSGQDWDPVAKRYSVQKICFYTSMFSFSQLTFNQFLSSCYFFEIDDLVSTFVGVQLTDFYINGYNAKLYGWIDGPYISDNLYIFQQTPLYTYTRQPAIVLQLGTTSGKYGQDFYVISPTGSQTGDYYGTDVTYMNKDNTAKGFDNNGLSAKYWNCDPADPISYGYSALKIMFSRDIQTYDPYDKSLLSTMIFCLHIFTQGTINSQVTDKSCSVVELSYSYPRIQIPSSWGFMNSPLCLAILCLVLMTVLF